LHNLASHVIIAEVNDVRGATWAHGADALVIICSFCDIMYEIRYNLPVLFYPQLLGLAMGLSADEVGLPLNRVKSRKLMEMAR
jgi:heterodisulfide reductase subunit B